MVATMMLSCASSIEWDVILTCKSQYSVITSLSNFRFTFTHFLTAIRFSIFSTHHPPCATTLHLCLQPFHRMRALACVRVGKKILFGYSYVNRVSQQEKSKCVTMRYAHKIRVYGSKTFYRSMFVRVRVCTCIHVEMIWYRSHCVCMMALFENMHVLTRITYMSMKNMKSPSAHCCCGTREYGRDMGNKTMEYVCDITYEKV